MTKKEQPKGERWPDGINPYILPERRAAIMKARAERDAEIAEWRRKNPGK